MVIHCTAATGQPTGDQKTVIVKTTPGEMPFPWSEKDPYRLPVSIDRVQKMLITLGTFLQHLAIACCISVQIHILAMFSSATACVVLYTACMQ